MSDPDISPGVGGTAAMLRREFDRSFAAARRTEPEPLAALLNIRIRGDRFALRLSEIGGLFTERKVTPVPGPLPELLGIAGFRGAIVPVYDLGALVGYPGGADFRWLVLSGGSPPIGLAFEEFEGLARLRSQDLAPADGALARRHVREPLQNGEGVLALVHVPSIVEAITNLSRYRT